MGKKQLTGLKCEKPIAVSKKKINNVIFLTALNNNRNLQKILICLKTYQQISC